MKFHKTKNGDLISLTDLTTSHLKNIIKSIERRAKEGVIIRMGGGSSSEDMWLDEETIFGEDAKVYMNIVAYRNELKNRTNKI